MLRKGDKVYVWHTTDMNLVAYLLSLLNGFDTMLEVTDVDYENYSCFISGYEFPISIDEVIRC